MSEPTVIFVKELSSLAEWITPLSTLIAAAVGAFLGVFFNFLVTLWNSKQKKRDSGLVTITTLQIDLSVQYAKLGNLYNQKLKSNINDELAWLKVSPLSKYELFDYDVDNSQLAVFLDFEEPGIIGELNQNLALSNAAIETLNIRSDLYVNELQPLMRSAASVLPLTSTDEDFARWVFSQKPLLVIQLKQNTEELIKLVKQSVDNIYAMNQRLNELCKNNYEQKKRFRKSKKRKCIKFEPIGTTAREKIQEPCGCKYTKKEKNIFYSLLLLDLMLITVLLTLVLTR